MGLKAELDAPEITPPTEGRVLVYEADGTWQNADLTGLVEVGTCYYDVFCSSRLFWKMAADDANAGDETATSGAGRCGENAPDERRPIRFEQGFLTIHYKSSNGARIRIEKSSP